MSHFRLDSHNHSNKYPKTRVIQKPVEFDQILQYLPLFLQYDSEVLNFIFPTLIHERRYLDSNTFSWIYLGLFAISRVQSKT